MKKIVTGLAILAAAATLRAQSITDIYNRNWILDSMQGNKMMVVVLPEETDTVLFNQLINFHSASPTVKMIGLLTNLPAGADSIYSDLGNAGIIISQGIAATDTSGEQRTSVIRYLTTISNGRNENPSIIGAKFFMSEHGRLFANTGNDIPLSNQLIADIVNTNVPGEN